MEDDLKGLERAINAGKQEMENEEEKYKEMIRNTDPHSYWRFCIKNIIINEANREQILGYFLKDLRETYNPIYGVELQTMITKFPQFPQVIFSELIKPESSHMYLEMFDYFNDFEENFSQTIIPKNFTLTIYHILKESKTPIECVSYYMSPLLTCLRKGCLLLKSELLEINSSIKSFFEESYLENPLCVELYGRTEGIIFNRYQTLVIDDDTFHKIIDELFDKKLISVIIYMFYEIDAKKLFSFLETKDMLPIFNNILTTEMSQELMIMVLNIFQNLFKNLSNDEIGFKLIKAINWNYFAAFCIPSNELIGIQFVKCINKICKKNEEFPGMIGFEPFRTIVNIGINDDIPASIRQKALEILAFHFPNFSDDMMNCLIDKSFFEQIADIIPSMDERPLEYMVSFTIDLINRVTSKGDTEAEMIKAILVESGYEESMIDAIEDQDVEKADMLLDLFDTFN